MDFSEALKRLKNGKCMRRQIWPETQFIKRSDDGKCVKLESSDTKDQYNITCEDIFADDWELVYIGKYTLFNRGTDFNTAIDGCKEHPGECAMQYKSWDKNIAQVYDLDRDVFVPIRIDGCLCNIDPDTLKITFSDIINNNKTFAIYIRDYIHEY